jgi:hypothetical protein
MDLKLAQEAGQPAAGTIKDPGPATFNLRQEAADILAIADPETRRTRLRQRVALLSPSQVEELQRAIMEQKRQAEDNAWIDEV